MKNIYFILLAAATLMTGCVPPTKEVVKEIHVTNTSPNPGSNMPEPPASSSVGGLDDGGGGNGVNGKPLESYIVSFKDLPEVQEFVAPLIEELRQNAPLLARDMTYLIHERSWYIIPVKLDQISKANIGTFFKTDQLALQSASDVWVDKNLYSQMDTQAKARLLVHELLMGVRILEQLSNREKCFAEAADLIGSSAYRQARSKCFKSFPRLESESTSGVRLSKEDYSLIRKVTAKLFEPGSLQNIDLDTELHELKFRTR